MALRGGQRPRPLESCIGLVLMPSSDVGRKPLKKQEDEKRFASWLCNQ
jgi:hypothetical protein